jgi:soluble lytic murein transglycosylase-like protein
LETRVHDAAARLRELVALNQALDRRVRELERQLAAATMAGAAPAAPAEAAVGGPVSGQELARWEEQRRSWDAERAAWSVERAATEVERAEVRRRVEALTRRLEQLGAASAGEG